MTYLAKCALLNHDRKKRAGLVDALKFLRTCITTPSLECGLQALSCDSR